jgi:hypothetical protein
MVITWSLYSAITRVTFIFKVMLLAVLMGDAMAVALAETNNNDPTLLWQQGRYREAAAEASRQSGPLASLYAARWHYAQGRLQQAEQQAVAVALKFARSDPNRAEAYDLAARAAYLRGDYPAAARYARSQCLLLPLPLTAAQERLETLDGLDPFCRRAPASFLARYKSPRSVEALASGSATGSVTGLHTAPMSRARPTVAAKINGTALSALFDSGAENSFVQLRDVARLGVRRTGATTEIQGFTSDRVRAEWGIIGEVELLGWRLREMPVLILPDVFAAGAIPPLVIGLNELWPFRLSFDFALGQLSMEKSNGQPKNNGQSAALAVREALQIGPALKVPLLMPLNDGEKVQLYATIDTGSGGLILSRTILEAQGVVVPKGRSDGSIVGVSGNLAIERLTLTALELLGQRLTNQSASVAGQLPERGAAIFGTDFFQNQILVIDLQAEGAFLRPK